MKYILNEDFLRCSITGNCVGLANDQHMMWVCVHVDTQISATATPTSEATHTSTPVITMDSLPRLPDLLKLGVPQKLGVHYRQLGTFLLDDDGYQVDNVQSVCRDNPEILGSCAGETGQYIPVVSLVCACHLAALSAASGLKALPFSVANPLIDIAILLLQTLIKVLPYGTI